MSAFTREDPPSTPTVAITSPIFTKAVGAGIACIVDHVHAFREGWGIVVLEALMLYLLRGRRRKATMEEMVRLLATDR